MGHDEASVGLLSRDLEESSSSSSTSRSSSRCKHSPDRHYHQQCPRIRSRAQQVRITAVLAALFITTNTFYLLSLHGDPEPSKLNKRLGVLGAFLACATVAASLQLWLSCWPGCCSIRTRTRSVWSQALMFAAWVAYDHGSQLEHHGSYNLLIFTLMFSILNLVIAYFASWAYFAGAFHKNARRFVVQVFTVTLVTTVSLLVIIGRKQRALDRGFFGHSASGLAATEGVSEASLCQWRSSTPWFDLVPFRQNFFVGPMTCKPITSFWASFVNDSLVIDCDAASTEVPLWLSGGQRRFNGPAYSVLPRTEEWGLTFKNDSLQSTATKLQENVLRFIEGNTFDYANPIKMESDIDTVLAWCGTSEPKIVHRIVPAPAPGMRHENALAIPSPASEALNVVCIFIDAVSRAHFHRRLPQTVKAIERLAGRDSSDSPELFEFFRYHTVGLNTSPNTRAMWAGLEAERPIDTEPRAEDAFAAPLWEQFQSAGYVSSRIDPMCQDWSAYYNPSHLSTLLDSQASNSTPPYLDRLPGGPRIAHEQLTWSCLPPYLPLGLHFAGNFAGATSIKSRCLSGTHVGWHALDWADSFLDAYGSKADAPRAFHINAAFMEGHEGSGEVLATLDERLASFLGGPTSKIDYSNTAVVIASDHGALMGLNNALFTNGKVEAANPFAALLLPKSWTSQAATSDADSRAGGEPSESETAPTTQASARRDTSARPTRWELLYHSQTQLITAFDIYETLRGFMPSKARQQAVPSQRRGYDLAREAVPVRSCADAGIDAAACRCDTR